MQTASELLAFPSAPLSASLVVRPVRACVFVPAVESIAWQRLVEHALAAQTRVWGGWFNLVVPTAWDLGNDELFWRLIDRFDPDVVGLHVPTYSDIAEVAPASYAKAIERAEEELRGLGFDDEERRREISGLGDDPFWEWQLSNELQHTIVERVATLRLGDEPRSVRVDGTKPPSYPLTDVAALRELPETVLDVRTTLGDVDRLMLTHAIGRLLPSLRAALEKRGTTINEVVIDNEGVLLTHVWPRGTRSDYGYPQLLAETGLARRVSMLSREAPVVVAGDHPRDFLLYHGLSRLRPPAFWFPKERLGDSRFVRLLADALHSVLRSAGGAATVTTAESEGVADDALEALNGLLRGNVREARAAEWKELIPRSSVWAADARSERRVSLLRHEGETQELPTPTPVSISADDFTELRWMVDVEAQGWCPPRHRALGELVLRGPMVTETDARTSSMGPSYFGQGHSCKRSLVSRDRQHAREPGLVLSLRRSRTCYAHSGGKFRSPTKERMPPKALACSEALASSPVPCGLSERARCLTRT
jgi:hypothetical protein